ncbi:MAG TPA: LysM peptidoglycan-binding domain-containing protein [Spongiibacteraceae bacterium]|nr:LysM peptidoglycan-binding domain-containing protein [Spongiibacteraceae bacterium]
MTTRSTVKDADAPLWQRIRDGYQFDRKLENPLIDAQINWYRNNPTFVYRATERSSRYLHYVVSAVQQRNMPTEIALLPFIESAYDPFAYSRSGASGLWQFVPQTATNFGLKRNWWYDGRKDVIASTDAALDYLQFLHDKFDNDWLLAIAAYNFGEGSIQRAINANQRKGLPTDFWHLSLREETRIYVPRLLAFTRVVAEPQRYGISLYSVPDRAYFAAAETKGQLALARAAKLADVDIDELLRLNAGLNHAVVAKDTPQRILLPVSAFDQFTRELAVLPPSERVQWQQYKVVRGDTLTGLSRRFDVPATALAAANGLRDKLLKPGQELLIPHGTVEVAQSNPPPINAQTPFGSTQIFHTVEAGDNLRRLSQLYGVSVQNIQRWNGLSANDPIKLGQKLNIWTDKVGSRPAKIAASSSTKKVGYTIQNGDSLNAIADRFNIEIDDILRWNQINPRALLQPGRRLTLFVSQ